jgi:transposase InsO family protein
MDLIEDLADPTVSVVQACAALGVSRATLYRSTQPPLPPTIAQRTPNPRRLSGEERQRVLDVLHSARFADQPPPEVYATLLSEGIYVASIRTMYRLLADRGETADRRAQRAPVKHAKPTLTATAPNQVWTWDITKVRGPLPGIFYFVYVVLDLFSRMVVGWMLAERESAAHAERLFAEAVARHSVSPGVLTVHADRGSPMKSSDLAELFAVLGIARSFSRPHVSDDNAFSESHFKTMKYQPDYPDQFLSPSHARGWFQQFFSWYNDEHQHSGLALFAPADVFHGRVEEVAARRQQALDTAYTAHPERFPNGPPVVKKPPAAVHINPIPTDEVAVVPALQSKAESTTGTSLSSNELAREASSTQPVATRAMATQDFSEGSARLARERTPRQGAPPRPHATWGVTRDDLPASVPS